MPAPGFPPPAGPPASSRPPVRRSSTAAQYRGQQSRTSWYLGFGVIVLLIVAGAIVIINGNNRLVDDGDQQVTESTVRVASEPPLPPVTAAPSTTPSSTTPATSPVTTTPVTTVMPTPITPPTTVAPTVPVTTALPLLADVADATGTFVVQLPMDYDTNVEPVTIGGSEMSNVTGAIELEQYLAGDFSVVGATVLSGPTAEVGTAGAVLADFDPGETCGLTDFETSVDTAKGPAVVLSYDNCGDGQYSLVLMAVEIADLQRTVFVGVQHVEPSWGAARDLAIAILESYRPA